MLPFGHLFVKRVFETARVLALSGAHVVLACRTLSKCEAAISELKGVLPAKKEEYRLTPLECELSDLRSVDNAAKTFKSMNLPLHILIANAGIMALPTRQESVDGIEMQVATNHLGHFHLVTSLLDTMASTAKTAGTKSRVVAVSSLAHENSLSPREFLESPNLEVATYSGWDTYGARGVAVRLDGESHSRPPAGVQPLPPPPFSLF